MFTIVDFQYQNEYSFFEYYYKAVKQNKTIQSPTSSTLIKEVNLSKPGNYLLNDLVVSAGQPCIVMVITPMKNVVWEYHKEYTRARCFTKIRITDTDNVKLIKKCSNRERMFIIQGDLESIQYENARAFYKEWATEEKITERKNRPVPKYINEFTDRYSIIDNNSETTVINCVDAGWWFSEQSFTEWYSPYMTTWRKAGLNVLSWRTPGLQQFGFGFDIDPAKTAKIHKDLVKKHFPNTKRVIYFGQCLGAPKTIITACEYQADDLYITSTFFDPLRHRSSHLMQMVDYKSMDALEYLSNSDYIPKSTFIYKNGDGEERNEHGRFLYEIGKHENIRHVISSYLDVWSPVLSETNYGFFQTMGLPSPNTRIDLGFREDPKLRKRIIGHA